VGTSISFRAPNVPRWQAFTTALVTDQPLERVRAELFNAGVEWETALATPAVAAFAAALAEAQDVLPQLVAQAERPERAIQEYVADTRSASTDEGGTPALAVAERAFAALLTRTASHGESLTTLDSESAAAHLERGLANPQATVVAYLGEILGQYARHVVAREAGRLTEEESAARGAAETRKTIRAVATSAEEVARGVTLPHGDTETFRERWSALVADAFREGRRLPVADT
jgi:hypothetical protein